MNDVIIDRHGHFMQRHLQFHYMVGFIDGVINDFIGQANRFVHTENRYRAHNNQGEHYADYT